MSPDLGNARYVLFGYIFSLFKVAKTSLAALVTSLSPGGGTCKLAVCPWHRKSTSTNCQLGNFTASRLAKERRFRRDPKMP